MTVLIEALNDCGAIGVKTIGDDGSVHRRVIEPGHLNGTTFVPTDLSAELSEIQTMAVETWTAEIVSAWQAKLLSEITQPPPPVTSVSARQFKLQLLASGLLDQVETFVASQGRAVQIAYDNSGSFVRSEPMMAAGFAALGFAPEQVDEFFVAASKL